MKTKYILLISFVAVFISGILQARGFRFGTVEDVKVVAKLPRTEEFKIGVDPIDLGAKYTAFQISGLNAWIKEEPRLVAVSLIHKNTYYDLQPDEIAYILQSQKLKKDDLLHLSLWERYGALFLFIPALGLVLLVRRYSQSGPEDEIIYTDKDEKPQA